MTADDFAALVERLRKLGATRVQAGELVCELPPVQPTMGVDPGRERAKASLTKAERDRLEELEEKVRRAECLP